MHLSKFSYKLQLLFKQKIWWHYYHKIKLDYLLGVPKNNFIALVKKNQQLEQALYTNKIIASIHFFLLFV